jgi:hypothetical protein
MLKDFINFIFIYLIRYYHFNYYDYICNKIYLFIDIKLNIANNNIVNL